MKKICVIVAMLTLMITGCNTAEVSDKVQVYTSFYAMTDFAKEIAGDKADVKSLVPTGTEPHEYEPTVEDMKNVLNADVFVYNGSGMEHWVDDIEKTISGSDVKVVEASKGIPVKINDADPHIWLDPDNALYEMEQIKNALAEKDPQNASYYEENYKNCTDKINSLKTEYEAFNGNGKSVIVTHEAYAYLFNKLNLNQVSIEGMNGESDPSPAQLTKIIDYIRSNNVKYVFSEELDSNKVADSVASETGIQVLNLNPFEGSADGKSYFETMEENLKALKMAVE